ncbi:RNA helicase-like protein [Phlyctema vagabunda]|uniref:RNA helicase-like protein n=1 Tax=Phlyctema vagabunda TaxID=108571 RepID=A0ABR4PBT1_9HELO
MSDHASRYLSDDRQHHPRSRSKSPRRHRSSPHRRRSPHKHRRHHAPKATQDPLPYNSRSLTKRDYAAFKPMFALYLDIQKNKILEELEDSEVKGRWKSFLGKWNRGELSEGWYDPSTLSKAIQSAAESDEHERREEFRPRDVPPQREQSATVSKIGAQDSDSDDSVGPALPSKNPLTKHNRLGPSIPSMEDLELKRGLNPAVFYMEALLTQVEMEAEDGLARRDDIRYARKIDRKDQKEKLDELVPRAEAGTRERQLEKKKEVNEKMKSFRERSPGAAEVPDTELMGGGDGVDSYKKEKKEFERKKNERELRKEEFLRARMAEREERLAEYRQKEDGTMAMLKALAKQNFG